MHAGPGPSLVHVVWRSQLVATAQAAVVLAWTTGVGMAMDEGGAPTPRDRASMTAPTEPPANPAPLPGLPLILFPGAVITAGLLARRRRTPVDTRVSCQVLHNLHRSTLQRRAALLRTSEPGPP